MKIYLVQKLDWLILSIGFHPFQLFDIVNQLYIFKKIKSSRNMVTLCHGISNPTLTAYHHVEYQSRKGEIPPWSHNTFFTNSSSLCHYLPRFEQLIFLDFEDSLIDWVLVLILSTCFFWLLATDNCDTEVLGMTISRWMWWYCKRLKIKKVKKNNLFSLLLEPIVHWFWISWISSSSYL